MLDDDGESDAEGRRSSSTMLMRNFLGMAVMFSITHGCVVSCLSYATAELGAEKGAWGNGTLFAVYALAALLLSKPSVAMLGGKWGLFAGLAGYCLYIGGFLFAVIFKGVDWVSWSVYMLTCVIGGLSGGLLWTAQGRYFANNSKKFSEALEYEVANGEASAETQEDAEISKVNARFASIFAFIYLGCEALTKVTATILFLFCGQYATYIVFTVYSVAAVAGTIFFMGCSDLGDKGTGDVTFEATFRGVGDATKLLMSDRRLALLMPYQWSFGVAGSFIGYYVFGFIVSNSENLGNTWVGLLSAIITITGSAMAVPYAYIANKFGKEVVMVWGGLCFSLVGFFLYCEPDSALGTWAWIVPFFIVMGMGRGAWESTNKAVVADFYADTPQNTASAFACVSFNNGMSGAIAYYVFAGTSRTATCSIVFAFGLLGIICYLLSVRTHSHRLVSKEYDSLPRKSDV